MCIYTIKKQQWKKNEKFLSGDARLPRMSQNLRLRRKGYSTTNKD